MNQGSVHTDGTAGAAVAEPAALAAPTGLWSRFGGNAASKWNRVYRTWWRAVRVAVY
jgi:hypothetical protein